MTNGAPAKRLDRVLAHVRFALTELRQGRMRRHNLALILKHRLGPVERAFLMWVAAEAAEPADLDQLGFFLGGPPPFEMDGKPWIEGDV